MDRSIYGKDYLGHSIDIRHTVEIESKFRSITHSCWKIERSHGLIWQFNIPFVRHFYSLSREKGELLARTSKTTIEGLWMFQEQKHRDFAPSVVILMNLIDSMGASQPLKVLGTVTCWVMRAALHECTKIYGPHCLHRRCFLIMEVAWKNTELGDDFCSKVMYGTVTMIGQRQRQLLENQMNPL